MKHVECAATGCDKIIGSHSLFCRRHLDRLPRGMIYQIHKAWHAKRRNQRGTAEFYAQLVADAKELIAIAEAKAKGAAA